jgi:hypothetical protein
MAKTKAKAPRAKTPSRVRSTGTQKAKKKPSASEGDGVFAKIAEAVRQVGKNMAARRARRQAVVTDIMARGSKRAASAAGSLQAKARKRAQTKSAAARKSTKK